MRREGKLCRRSASRKMNLLTAHCVVSSVRVQRRVRFPSSVSVSIMKARASSAARSLRLHALRRRSSAKIEFPESRCYASALFLCAAGGAAAVQGGRCPPWIPLRFRRNRRGYPPLVRTADEAAPRRRGQRSKSQVHAPTFTGNLMRPAAAGLSALLAEGKIGRK